MAENSRSRLRTWLPPAICIAVISIMSNAWISATSFKGTVGKAIPVKNGVQWFDAFWERFWWVFVKGFHVGEFFLLTLLAHRAFRRAGKWQAGKAVVGAAALAAAFAIVDEWHQHFIAYRGGRWTDVMIDWGGVLAATLLLGFLHRKRAT